MNKVHQFTKHIENVLYSTDDRRNIQCETNKRYASFFADLTVTLRSNLAQATDILMEIRAALNGLDLSPTPRDIRNELVARIENDILKINPNRLAATSSSAISSR